MSDEEDSGPGVTKLTTPSGEFVVQQPKARKNWADKISLMHLLTLVSFATTAYVRFTSFQDESRERWARQEAVAERAATEAKVTAEKTDNRVRVIEDWMIRHDAVAADRIRQLDKLEARIARAK